MSIFRDIKVQEREREHLAEVKRIKIKELNARPTLNEQKYNELRKKAEGFKTLFLDHRHKFFIEFIHDLYAELNKDLRFVSRQSKNIEEQALLIRGISKQMELLERLENDPISIVKQLKSKKRVE